MPHLTPDEFLVQLEQLFAARRVKGSVFLVQKRLTYEPEPSTSTSTGGGATVPAEDVEMGEAGVGAGEREWPLLVRATDGKAKKDEKVRLSTVVPPTAADAFLEAYSALLRAAFQPALRPKRKRADLVRARALKAAKRAAAAARRRGEPTPTAEETDDRVTKEVKAGEARAKAAAAAGAGAFRPRLPKVVGPRRGNGVKKRRRAEKRREKAVERVKRKARAKAQQ
ncbi:hypothetical protein JCM3770_002164 [Rhodotorula araucariae]